MTIPDVDLGDSENVAVSFEEMKQKLSLSETVVKEGVFACLVISNIYHFFTHVRNLGSLFVFSAGSGMEGK